MNKAAWEERLERLDSWDRVPGHTKAAMLDYLTGGPRPGGFLTAVLTNDLMGAVGKADLPNRAAIVDIATVVWSGFPASSWGTEEKVASWLNRAA